MSRTRTGSQAVWLSPSLLPLSNEILQTNKIIEEHIRVVNAQSWTSEPVIHSLSRHPGHRGSGSDSTGLASVLYPQLSASCSSFRTTSLLTCKHRVNPSSSQASFLLVGPGT